MKCNLRRVDKEITDEHACMYVCEMENFKLFRKRKQTEKYKKP